jgi:hypothetical protein
MYCWYIAVDTLSTLLGSLLLLSSHALHDEVWSPTGYEPDFCCLGFGLAAEQIKTFIGGGGLVIYYRSSAA